MVTWRLRSLKKIEPLNYALAEPGEIEPFYVSKGQFANVGERPSRPLGWIPLVSVNLGVPNIYGNRPNGIPRPRNNLEKCLQNGRFWKSPPGLVLFPQASQAL